MALRRGIYKELFTGNLYWLLYELDGKVHAQSRKTGEITSWPDALFAVMFTWHSEAK